MELIRGLHNLRPQHLGCVATIGAFDGVHRGHQAVIQQVLDAATHLGLPSTVIVFEPLPREYFAPLASPPRLMNLREKYSALKALGVDRLLCIRFTEEFRQMDALTFIDRVFVSGLGVRHVVIGDDWRFGNDRKGDLALMQAEGSRHGFEAVPTGTVSIAGERVSSTRLRKALAEADFELAQQLLGRPFTLSGRVVFGRQLGRTLGAPTANINLHRLRAPLSGVFAVEVNGAGREPLFGVANMGTRPTVDDSIFANLEVHLFNFSGDIYGRRLTVNFRHKLREEQKFASLEALQQQIAKDVESGRAYFGQ